jgi:hypothetical protein
VAFQVHQTAQSRRYPADILSGKAIRNDSAPSACSKFDHDLSLSFEKSTSDEAGRLPEVPFTELIMLLYEIIQRYARKILILQS